jgi:hypothetical protein
VTRLGEFLLYGRLFTLISFLNSQNSSFFDYFFRRKSSVLFLTKMSWASFLAIFSQTHLVTLPTIDVSANWEQFEKMANKQKS